MKIKQNILLIAIALQRSLLFGQISISNTLTADHVPFRDQRYLIIPPQGFIPVSQEDGNGFIDTVSGSTIILSEIPFGFKDFIPALDTEQLKAARLKLISKEPLTYHQKEGFFLTMEEEKGFKQVLMFGNQEITVVLEGNVPYNAPQLILPVKEALFSLAPTYSSEVIPYAINTTDTEFILAEQVDFKQIYTTDGLYPSESADKRVFVADIYTKDLSTYNKMIELNNALSQLPLLEYQVDDNLFDAISINGLSGYEVVVSGVDEEGEKVKVYIVMLFLNSSIYQMYGITTEEDKIRDFRKLAYSFQLVRP
jgi:hypothetical protein